VRVRSCLLLAVCVLGLPTLAQAQDFGVLQSAETINKGNFKLRFNPLVVFGRGEESNEAGVAILAGYGFTPSFDLEGGVAFYDGVTFLGANAEFWVLKHRPVDISIAGGFHGRFVESGDDYSGIDLTFLASGNVAPRLELYGGLDFGFEALGKDFDYTTIHLVPGIEYKINENIDLVAEFGIALNDDSRHYLTGGLAIYFR